MSERRRAVAYLRVSKVGKREGDDFLSPELQQTSIEAYAKREKIDIVDVVQDIDRSGRDFRRRRVDEIISRVRAGEVDTVLLWKWSRWGRNLQQSQIFLAQLEDAGGRVFAAEESVDEKSTYGKFTRNFFLALAELQSDQIGDGWKGVFASRRERGLPHNATRRFGYRYVRPPGKSEGKQRYELVEEEAAVLAGAYADFVAGRVSTRRIAIGWNEKGFRTTTGRRWAPQSVRSAMDNGFAAGLIRERSESARRGGKRLDSFDSWREGAHPAIISSELWTAYREMRLATLEGAPARRLPKHALSGLLVCSDCGKTLRSHVTRGYLQWLCVNGQRGGIHGPRTISDRRAAAAVKEWVASGATGAFDVAGRARELAKPESGSKAEINRITRQLEVVRAKQTRLQEGWLSSDFDADFYYPRKRELADEREQLEATLRNSERRDRKVAEQPPVEAFVDIRTHWDEWAPLDQANILRELLSGVVVLPGRAELLFVPAWLD